MRSRAHRGRGRASLILAGVLVTVAGLEKRPVTSHPGNPASRPQRGWSRLTRSPAAPALTSVRHGGGRAPCFSLAAGLPVRRLPRMPTWILEPHNATVPDPGCPHCTRNPGYPHRHWRQTEPAAGVWEPNRVWRALFRLYGGGERNR